MPKRHSSPPTAVLAANPELASLSADDLNTAFNVNTRSAFLLIQVAGKHLTAPGARIVNIST